MPLLPFDPPDIMKDTRTLEPETFFGTEAVKFSEFNRRVALPALSPDCCVLHYRKGCELY